MALSRQILAIELILLLLALISHLAARRTSRITLALWLASACAGIVYAGMRYWMTWPMTPMFSGSILYPPLMAIFGALTLRRSAPSTAYAIVGWLVACGLLVTALGLCFPKDFYLPIIRTASPYAHGVLLFGSFGRACFFLAAAWGYAVLRGEPQGLQNMFHWLVWGFGCWTLSLFSGEVWSYTGWGVPMVWEDASTLTAIGTWLFYVGVLHLHLAGHWSRRMRAGMSVLGVALVLALNGGPDMGPLRNPLSIFWS